MESQGVYKNGVFAVDAGYTYVAFFQNASITYAFYYLVLFYMALHHFLKPYNPTIKFICIKSVLFLSFWQGVVLAAAAHFSIIQQFWIYRYVGEGYEMFFPSSFPFFSLSLSLSLIVLT